MKKSKIKKGVLTILSLMFALCVVFPAQSFRASAEGKALLEEKTIFNEEKSYCTATLKDDFADDRVMVVLNQAASTSFREYTASDFPEAACSLVRNLSGHTDEIVRLKINAERFGDLTSFQETDDSKLSKADLRELQDFSDSKISEANFSELRNVADSGLSVNTGDFRKILCLNLTEKSKENVLETIKRLEKRDDVLSVEPDYRMTYFADPNPRPTEYSSQTSLVTINMSQAWDITKGSSSVVVGVADAAIDVSHPDLKDRVDKDLSADFVNMVTSSLGCSTVEFPGPLQKPSDSHGTAVAGIIGAQRNSGTPGITGVAQNIRLASLAIADPDEDGTSAKAAAYVSSLVRALDFATEKQIPIVNCSSGYYLEKYDNSSKKSALEKAIRNYPGLFVAAVGNGELKNKKEGTNNDDNPVYPASFGLPNLISVGNSYQNGNRYYNSNFGKNSVDLFAPGDSILSTIINGGYDSYPGTSMSAPHVAGVAALIKSKYPNATAANIRVAIMNGVDKIESLKNDCVSGGRLNAYKALQFAGKMWMQPTWTSNSNVNGIITASGTYGNEYPWKAYNGTLTSGTAPNCDNWSVKETSGWLQLTLSYYVNIQMIEFYNGVSSASNRTKAAKFTGRDGVALGSSFTAPNQDYGYVQIQVDNVLTNVIQLNISSSYGSYVSAGLIVIHATVPETQPNLQTWTQPIWTSNSNSHGTISASGTYGNEYPWKAYNGTMIGGTAPNCDNWSVKATNGWIELKLDYPVRVTSIEIWNGVSSGSNYTKAAYFSGIDGMALGSAFTLVKSDYAYQNVSVNGVWTNIIRFNATSSYGSYVCVGKIIIHATA